MSILAAIACCTDGDLLHCIQVLKLLRRVLEEDYQLCIEEMVALFSCRGADFHAVTSAAGRTADVFPCVLLGLCAVLFGRRMLAIWQAPIFGEVHTCSQQGFAVQIPCGSGCAAMQWPM